MFVYACLRLCMHMWTDDAFLFFTCLESTNTQQCINAKADEGNNFLLTVSISLSLCCSPEQGGLLLSKHMWSMCSHVSAMKWLPGLVATSQCFLWVSRYCQCCVHAANTGHLDMHTNTTLYNRKQPSLIYSSVKVHFIKPISSYSRCLFSLPLLVTVIIPLNDKVPWRNLSYYM